jgi:phospholipid transport system transporter-binding protein
MNDLVFYPSNVLTFETVQSDNSRLLKLLGQEPGVSGIRLNLLNVTHCDSTGLALLIETKRLCKQYKKTFVMENMSDAVQALAEFCGVDVILKRHMNNECK